MIPIAEPCIGQEELHNVIEAVKSGWISSRGGFIEEFEQEFASYCGMEYGVATSSGTAALHLALLALGVGKGDEVIIPDLTFIATANAVVYCNATPVFVDVHPEYWCIDPEKIEKKITNKTKVVIPVHLYGHPCEMDAIMDIANEHDIYVVEDAAEAHGAEYKGKKVGSFGDVSCFSFYGNKLITTGEGGICLTDDGGLFERMRLLRDHGMDTHRRYWHDVIGYNYRMTNLQAAVGTAQVKKLDSFVSRKREIARLYAQGLKALEKDELIKLHPEMHWAKSVYWMYSILWEHGSVGGVMRRLEEKGIDTRPFFCPIHSMPPHRTKGKFPIADSLSEKGINLPSSVMLSSEQVAYVCESIERIVRGEDG